MQSTLQMRTRRQQRSRSLWVGSSLASVGLSWVLAPGAIAQRAEVIFDGTIGPAAGTTLDAPAVVIPATNGLLVNGHLLHSFDRFNLFDGGQITFASDPGTRSIISRVTGLQTGFAPSLIDGTLAATGVEHVFLINPDGIVFGDRAQLRIPNGSFWASTTDTLVFSDGTQFSASNPQPGSNLLTLTGDPSGFLASLQTPGPLRVQGDSSRDRTRLGLLTALPPLDEPGLAVSPGYSLVLLGGEVVIDGGGLVAEPENADLTRRRTLLAPGGRIEIGSLTGLGQTVNFDLDRADGVVADQTANLQETLLNFEPITGRGDITLQNGAILDVTNADQGNIVLQGRNLTIVDSLLCAGLGPSSVCGRQNGVVTNVPEAIAGNIFLGALEEVLIQSSRIENDINPGATGNAQSFATSFTANTDNLFGSIVVSANAIAVEDQSQLSTTAFGTGNAGAVFLLAAGPVTFRESNIFSNVEAAGLGDAGTILVTGASLDLLDGSQFQTGALAREVINPSDRPINAGAIRIAVTGDITLSGRSRPTERNPQGFPSAIFSDIEGNVVGNAGLITITGNALILDDAGIDSSIRGIGTAGGIEIATTEQVALRNGSSIRSTIFATATAQTVGATVQGNLFGNERFTLDGEVVGAITILTSLLTLDNSFLDTTTFGTGDAGAVLIFADEVQLNASGIFSRSQATLADDGTIATLAQGDAGGILIFTTGSLIAQNESLLTTSSFALGDAGQILVIAGEDIRLDGQSGIFSQVSETAIGQSGDVGLVAGRFVVLTDGSQVLVDNQGADLAGNLFIYAPNGGIWLADQSTISATTLSGQGGNVELEAPFLVLINNSEVTTTAGRDQFPGDGGNILVRTISIQATPFANSNIVARAFTGTGGSIRIEGFPQVFLDTIAERPEVPVSNDIDASSDFGISGNVSLNVNPLDPIREAADLPRDIVDVSGLVAQGCAAGDIPDARNIGELFLTGRGGLPPDLGTDVQTTTTFVELVTIAPTGEPEATLVPMAAYDPQTVVSVTPIVEAQGFQPQADGTIALVAATDTMPPALPLFTPFSCHAAS